MSVMLVLQITHRPLYAISQAIGHVKNSFGCLKAIPIFIIMCIALLAVSCASPKETGFAIFLTRDDVPPDKMEALSHVELAEHPLISCNDIITYNAQTHELKLTKTAFERVVELEVPVRGKSFLVCVDGAPVYWGAFWTAVSSISFDGVTIWKPYNSQEPPILTLEIGYPSSSFYTGSDPRNYPAIIESLEQSGKLVDELQIEQVKQLPNSLKGYELYSWEENGLWHFTLITGTNRTKATEEITSAVDYISEAGFVNIHVVGADAIKGVLSHLPVGEFVAWCNEFHIGETTWPNLQLPPAATTDSIIGYARQYGLDFLVTAFP